MRVFKFSLILLIVAVLLSFVYGNESMPIEKGNSISIEEVKAFGILEVFDSNCLEVLPYTNTYITNLNFKEWPENEVGCYQCFDYDQNDINSLIVYKHINFDVGWQGSKLII